MERNIKLLGIFNFFTDFKFHAAVLIIYFAQVTGSYLLATSLLSVVMVSAALFEVPTGIFSDMIGRKKTMMFGALSATTSAVLYAAGQSYWPLFIGAVFSGLSRAWYSGNNDAFLWDSIRESKSKESFAYHLGKTSSMFQLALMISAVTGSIIANWSFPLIMWLSVIPQGICVGISFFIQNPQRFTKGKTNVFGHLRESARHIWHNKRLRLLSITDIINFGIGEASFSFGAAFIATVWPIWAIGFSRMISFGGAFISYFISGKIIRKFGEYNVVIIGNVTTRVVNFLAYGIPSVVSPVLIASTAIWYGAREVSMNSLMQKEYTSEQRATLASISSFIGCILYGIAAPIIGFVADVYNPAIALIFVQFCMLSVLGILFKLKSMK